MDFFINFIAAFTVSWILQDAGVGFESPRFWIVLLCMILLAIKG